MNRIGRCKTVLVSLLITFVSLLLPLFGEGYVLMLISFSLLGIGNALMQTSLNPLLSNIVSGERLASNLTFGQFIKAIASFMASIRLLGKPLVLMSFLGIMCHVGIDVGTNATAPKILMERLGMTLKAAGFASDAVGQAGAVAIMAVGVVYLLCYTFKIKG